MNNFSCSQAKLVLYNNAPCWLLDQWSCLTIRHPFGTDNDRASIVFGYWQSSFRSNLLLAGQWNYIYRISRIHICYTHGNRVRTVDTGSCRHHGSSSLTGEVWTVNTRDFVVTEQEIKSNLCKTVKWKRPFAYVGTISWMYVGELR